MTSAREARGAASPRRRGGPPRNRGAAREALKIALQIELASRWLLLEALSASLIHAKPWVGPPRAGRPAPLRRRAALVVHHLPDQAQACAVSAGSGSPSRTSARGAGVANQARRKKVPPESGTRPILAKA